MNPLNLNLSEPNVVEINGNAIDVTAVDQITANATGSQFIYIIAHSDINTEQYQQLTNLGVEVLQTIAKQTYLCRYRSSDLDSIRRMQFIRTANVYGASLKTTGFLKANLLNQLDVTFPSVTIRLHPNPPQTTEQVAQELTSLLNLNLAQMTICSDKIQLNAPRQSLDLIAAIDSVSRIEENLPQTQHNEYARGILAQDWDYSAVGNPLNLNRWKGRYQNVCVTDTGVDVSHRVFKNRITKEMNIWTPYSERTSVDYGGHGTHVAGSVAEGVASRCGIMVQGMWADFGGNPDMYPPADTYKLMTDGFKAGADIHTNSWGFSYKTYQAEYNAVAKEVDKALVDWPTKVVTISAGNQGGDNGYEYEVGAQNACKNAITVGNSGTLRPNFGYSCCANQFSMDDPRSLTKRTSNGPARPEGGYEGRIKPDVVAPGVAVLSAKSNQMSQANFDLNQKYNPVSPRKEYIYMTGTSMSTPHVAGCCAVIREALTAPGTGWTVSEPSGALIKALLINGAVDLQDHYMGDGKTRMEAAPNSKQGFGRVDLTNSIFNIEGQPQTYGGSGFADARFNGPHSWIQPLSLDGVLTSPAITWTTKMFSVTLTWYDIPSNITENMLNLTIKNGDDVHYGNQTVRGGDKQDKVNNVQKVVWTRMSWDTNLMYIEVKCTRMQPGSPAQPFALAWMSHDA